MASLSELKQKWSGRQPDLSFSPDAFYLCRYYLPSGDKGIKPVIEMLSFETKEDAFAFYLFTVIPKYKEQEKLTPRIEKLADTIEKALKDGKVSDKLTEDIRKEHNFIFEEQNYRMPYIEAWGSLKNILNSKVVSDILSVKRIKANHGKLKGILDVKKFDDNDEEHVKLAERFIRSIW